MKRIFLFSLFILSTLSIYPVEQQFSLTETISLLQAFMNGKVYVQENGAVSFCHYENVTIKYEKSLDAVYDVLQECTTRAWWLESGWEATPLIRDIFIAVQQKKLIDKFTDEQKVEFEKKKESLIYALTQENGKFEVIFRAFQDFILDELPEKQILIQHLKDLEPKMFKKTCNNFSAEECAEKALTISENRKKLKQAFDAKHPAQINAACKNPLVASGEDESLNKAIEHIKRKLNK